VENRVEGGGHGLAYKTGTYSADGRKGEKGEKGVGVPLIMVKKSVQNEPRKFDLDGRESWREELSVQPLGVGLRTSRPPV